MSISTKNPVKPSRFTFEQWANLEPWDRELYDAERNGEYGKLLESAENSLNSLYISDLMIRASSETEYLELKNRTNPCVVHICIYEGRYIAYAVDGNQMPDNEYPIYSSNSSELIELCHNWYGKDCTFEYDL